jgi:hypothetical protein
MSIKNSKEMLKINICERALVLYFPGVYKSYDKAHISEMLNYIIKHHSNINLTVEDFKPLTGIPLQTAYAYGEDVEEAVNKILSKMQLNLMQAKTVLLFLWCDQNHSIENATQLGELTADMSGMLIWGASFSDDPRLENKVKLFVIASNEHGGKNDYNDDTDNCFINIIDDKPYEVLDEDNNQTLIPRDDHLAF